MGFSGFTKERKCFPFSFACNCAYKHTEQSTVQRYMGKIFVLVLWWMSCILYDLHSLTTAQITNYYPTKLVFLSCKTLFMCPHRHMHTYAFMHTWSFQHRGNLLGPGVKGHTAVLNERRWVCDDRFYVQWRRCDSKAKDYHLIKDKMKATWYGRALTENFTSKEIQISICCI